MLQEAMKRLSTSGPLVMSYMTTAFPITSIDYGVLWENLHRLANIPYHIIGL
jgi:hypothetical protein